MQVVSSSGYEFCDLSQTLPTISFSSEILSLHIIQIPIRFGLYCIFHYSFSTASAPLLWAISSEVEASQLRYKRVVCISPSASVSGIHLQGGLR